MNITTTRLLRATALGLVFLWTSPAWTADTVPAAIQQPGTQPREAGTLETPDKCDNCHGGYNPAVEPAFNWRGSMMANASRDAIFWATLAIAEQDFDGAGDLCIRCHSTAGWMAGRSTPTDGSGLGAGDADGVECEACHKMTNPDDSEHAGAQFPPFVANDGAGQGYYGSGMASLWSGSEKLGPYSDPAARHQFLQSKFHRDNAFCGTCHDVSNPVTGDLAHNFGAQLQDGVVASGDPASSVGAKAAFNNFPYQYGIVERTWSEFMSGALSGTRVSQYASLPDDLRAGAIEVAYLAAGGDYADGTPRYFNCQTCHMRAVSGPGCNKKGAPVRDDLPLHDMTGGNYWMPDVIQHQDLAGTLRLGGGLTTVQTDALVAGKSRAEQQLRLAASLEVTGDSVKVTNLTGHKLISGYPEGRRMWLRVTWFNSSGTQVGRDGAYGELTVNIPGIGTRTVRTLLDLEGTNTKIYEAHYAMTKPWANQLLLLGYDPQMPLAFDRLTGEVSLRLGELANGNEPYAETFHFVLNNFVAKDNRIPPYAMSYDEAKRRNALPVPAGQYGSPGTGGIYDYWDDFDLNPPTGAAYATIELMYQPTSWEYIQFLYLANDGSNAFLANEGRNLLDSWIATGMAEPVVMAAATWGTIAEPPAPACSAPGAVTGLTATGGRRSVTVEWSSGSPAPDMGYRVHYDQSGKLQFAGDTTATSYRDNRLSRGVEYCYVVTAWNDCDASGAFEAGVDQESAAVGPVCATAQ